jgi:hypothetical protein
MRVYSIAVNPMVYFSDMKVRGAARHTESYCDIPATVR